MTRARCVMVTVAITAALSWAGIPGWPAEARGTGYGDERVAVLQCKAESSGRLRVSAGSLTYETHVQMHIDDDCADTISRLLQAGMSISHSQAVDAGANASFNFVFLGL